MEEYLHIDDLSRALDQQYENLSSTQIDSTVEVVAQRYGDDLYVSPADIDLSEAHNDAVEIDIEGVDDTPIYADPNAAEGEHLCITWGNLGNDCSPPEGRAEDGFGNELFGIR